MTELVVEKGRFKWFYLKNKQGEYVACVATGRRGNALVFDYSVLNQNKDEWSRQTARNVAIGRIIAGKGCVGVPDNVNVKKWILTSLKNDRYTPSRLKQAAKFWLSEEETKRREEKISHLQEKQKTSERKHTSSR
jgi:hypothetical protein